MGHGLDVLRPGHVDAAVVEAVVQYDRSLPVLGLPGSAWLRLAEEAGLTTVGEAFADRAFAAIQAGDSYRVIPWQMGVLAKLLRLLPNGLYDRALGAVYLNGLWEAIDKFADQPTA